MACGNEMRHGILTAGARSCLRLPLFPPAERIELFSSLSLPVRLPPAGV